MADLYARSWALDDIIVRSGGDGRTVEAYAAVFDSPAEIRDQHGHYVEVIERTAFNRQIGLGTSHVRVFYNHGANLDGSPSGLGAVPIGSPQDIRPDGRGLRTVSRFNKSELADAALEAIRNGDITGYSFRGRIHKSRKQRSGAMDTVYRSELGLTEYGPTPTPAYADAGILAVRSVAGTLATLDEEQRAELLRMLASTTPQDQETRDTATPNPGPGAEDQPLGHSGRHVMDWINIRSAMRSKGALK